MNSQLDDPVQKIMFQGGHWARVSGGGAAVDHEDGVVYMALSLRNAGTGIGVILGWHAWPTLDNGLQPHVAPEDFRHQSRDLYIPAGGIGLWQGALRDNPHVLHGQP